MVETFAWILETNNGKYEVSFDMPEDATMDEIKAVAARHLKNGEILLDWGYKHMASPTIAELLRLV